MKKKIIIIIGIVLLIVLIFIGYKVFFDKTPVYHSDAILLGNYRDIKDVDNTILKSYSEYIKYFDNKEITEDSFINNNYALIKIEYDPCADSNIVLTDYKINDNKMDVYFEYDETCGVCPYEYMYFLIKLDKNIDNLDIENHYKAISYKPCNPYETKKPLIYIYPDHDMNVSIKLGKPELLTTTYPKYNNGWNVYAKTNGDLIINDRLYYGLYWEGLNNINNSFNDGYVVYKDDLIPFLEDKLRILGLNDREANEFIIYWLPILEQNEYNLIRFESIDIINEQMPLIINPKPDSIIRVLMEYKKVDKDYIIKEQELITPSRNGFTVVEWGGTLIK